MQENSNNKKIKNFLKDKEAAEYAEAVKTNYKIGELVDILKNFQGIVGPQGPKGQDGKNGKDGKDGKTPRKYVDYFTDDEIRKIIEFSTPIKGQDYFTERDVKQLCKEVKKTIDLSTLVGPEGPKGKDGEDGKDGSPDKPEEIAAKLNTLKEAVDWSVIKNIPLEFKNKTVGKFSRGVSAFTGLSDVPSSYTGQSGKAVRVKTDETGLEFITFPTSGWSLTGNAGTTAGTNFVGTTDDVDLVFKRNSIEAFRIPTGSTSADTLLKVAGSTSFQLLDNSGNTFLQLTGTDLNLIRGGGASQITIGATNIDITPDTAVTISSSKELRFVNGANYVGFKPGTLSGNTIWTLPTTDSTGTQALVSNGSGVLSWATFGDVTAASAFGTDNRLIRSDGTGKGVQSSGVTLDDTANMSGIVNLTSTGQLLSGNGTAALPSYTFTNSATTGFYRASADTIGISIGGTSRGTWSATSLSINSSNGGSLSVGDTAQYVDFAGTQTPSSNTFQTVRTSLTWTPAVNRTNAFAFNNQLIIGGSTTGLTITNLIGNRSAILTAAGSTVGFTFTDAIAFEARQIAHNGSGTVTGTNETGFFANNMTNTVSTNKRGFVGELSSGTNKWNLYMSGTAQNYLEGSLGIGVSVPTAKLDVTQTGTTTPVQKLSSTATNDDPTEITLQSRTTTTNATVTTLGTIATTTGYSYLVVSRIIGRRTGGASGAAGDYATYEVRASANNEGGVLNVDAVTTTTVFEDQAGWDATIDASGTDLRVRVTGAASNNITWHATTMYYLMST